MGTKAATGSPGLAGALFSSTQQRVLGLLFGQPDRRFQSAELIRLARSGTGAVHRQLSRLERAGWVAVTREGNHKYYQANSACPAFAELQGLIAKTVGLVEPLRRGLDPLIDGVRAAFVYGSIAKGEDSAGSDIDLLVVSDALSYPDLFAALQDVEAGLGRAISLTVMGLEEWRAKRATRGSFAARIAAEPRLFVIGSDDDLT